MAGIRILLEGINGDKVQYQNNDRLFIGTAPDFEAGDIQGIPPEL
jgi:hypothetical protein